jgi:pimeloyl-ACP methyl ester carboxylesterase
MRAGVFVELEQIRVPVTLVWPQYDRLISRPKRLPPFVQSIELPDVGHIPMLEAPDAVARVLLDARDPAIEPAAQR